MLTYINDQYIPKDSHINRKKKLWLRTQYNPDQYLPIHSYIKWPEHASEVTYKHEQNCFYSHVKTRKILILWSRINTSKICLCTEYVVETKNGESYGNGKKFGKPK